MKRSLYERTKAYFLHMGRCSRVLKGPAVIGLAACMFFHHMAEYFRKGTKRFACAIFILACFMVGNSFAYPVFQKDSGFLNEEASDRTVVVSEDSDITLAEEKSVEYDTIELLDDEDVLEGYSDAELHGMEEADKYSLEEILHENEEIGLIQQTDSEIGKEISDDSRQKNYMFDADDWKLLLINKQHPIPDGYTVTLGTIKTIKGNMKCDERIIDELLAMMKAAAEDGVTLAVCSPYRDLNRQEVLFNRKIKAYMDKGMSYMEAYKISSQAVTVPGASEHQLGLAIDIVSDTYTTLDEGFGETDAGKWLSEHSWEYGFILRYPKGKEYITGIEFEPWHFRYVGKEAAEVITGDKITLEEFWDKYL